MRSRLLFSLQNILWCGPKVGTCTTCPTWPSTGTKSGERWAEKGVSLCLDAQKGPRKKRNSKEIFRTVVLFFLMLVLLVEYIFLTTFYGLYFNHQLHISLSNFFKFLHVSWWPSVGSFHVLHLHLSFWLVGTTRLCRDLNSGPHRYQADMLPTELSWLGLQFSTFSTPSPTP